MNVVRKEDGSGHDLASSMDLHIRKGLCAGGTDRAGRSSSQVAVAWLSDKEGTGKQVTLKVSSQPTVEAMWPQPVLSSQELRESEAGPRFSALAVH